MKTLRSSGVTLYNVMYLLRQTDQGEVADRIGAQLPVGVTSGKDIDEAAKDYVVTVPAADKPAVLVAIAVDESEDAVEWRQAE